MEKDVNNTKLIPFRDIKNCYFYKETHTDPIGMGTYKFGFRVDTDTKIHQLYAETEVERNLWVAAFNYIIISTN